VQLNVRQKVRRIARVVANLGHALRGNAVGDVDLTAEKRVRHVAETAQVEPEHELVEMR
jgi:hypothetical protein